MMSRIYGIATISRLWLCQLPNSVPAYAASRLFFHTTTGHALNKQKHDADDAKSISSAISTVSSPSSSSRPSASRAAEKLMSVRPWPLHQTMMLLERLHQQSLSRVVPGIEPSQVVPSLPSSWRQVYDRDVKRHEVLEAVAVVCRAKLQQEVILRRNMSGSAKTPADELTSDQAANLTMAQLRRIFPRQLIASRADRLEVATYREDVVIPFARELRRAQQKLDQESGTKESFTKWMGEIKADETFGHSAMECRMHFDVLSDERTTVKHRIDRLNPALDNARFAYVSNTQISPTDTVDGNDDAFDPSSTTPLATTSTDFSFRRLLRYIFLHRLGPQRQGTWKDVSREVEALAQNVLQVTVGREESHSSNLSNPVSSPSNVSAASDSAIVELGPLFHLIQPPPPYTLPLVNAQGRYQGRLYERSIRATLSRYDEFKVVRRDRRSEHDLPISVYGLDLPKLRTAMNQALDRKKRADINRLLKQNQAVDDKVAFFKKRGRRKKAEAAAAAAAAISMTESNGQQ